jgi:hypothetical protein
MVGCGKKEVKNPPRCIYDQAVFADAARCAVNNENCFVHFKQNPFFNLLWENLSEGDGHKWLKTIDENYPSLKGKFEDFRVVDCVGSPRVFEYGEIGTFSPSTLRLVALAGELQSRVGGWEGQRGIQIGADFGGLCTILHAISEFASYTLVDLPEQLALAEKCLKACGLTNVVYLTPEQLPKGACYDLVVSDRSFSEFDRTHQELFFERILSCANAGFLLGRVFPKHYGVVPMNLDELKRRFEKRGTFYKWEMQEPTLEDENYLICFKVFSEELKTKT